ncbi:MAG: hypothetical protein NC293_08425 [Roseburia sp.]|nr:hypothetical protein [Roseburia sp.]
MKNKILMCVIVLVVAMISTSCSNKLKSNNTGLETSLEDDSEDTGAPEELNMSDIYDWDKAMIKNIGYSPEFGSGAIVQNDEYVFFPQNGNKVIRLNKFSKEEKLIMKFDEMGDEAAGVRFCLMENGLYIEYAGDVYTSDFEGNNVSKILSGSEMKKTISDIINDDTYDSSDIMALEFYQDN